MEHIKLIDCSNDIEIDNLKELYQSRLKYLTATLSYLDRIGVEATVTLQCEVRNKVLFTKVHIDTADYVFRKIVAEATKSFTTPDIALQETWSEQEKFN